MNIDDLAWEKMNGLIPAIVQDAFDGRVLMQGYMNKDALMKTLESGQVTFWSRSRQQLWTKGETSRNYLDLVDVHPDCDSDSLLIRARQEGPTCHLGLDTCFDTESRVTPELAFQRRPVRDLDAGRVDLPRLEVDVFDWRQVVWRKVLVHRGLLSSSVEPALFHYSGFSRQVYM